MKASDWITGGNRQRAPWLARLWRLAPFTLLYDPADGEAGRLVRDAVLPLTGRRGIDHALGGGGAQPTAGPGHAAAAAAAPSATTFPPRLPERVVEFDGWSADDPAAALRRLIEPSDGTGAPPGTLADAVRRAQQAVPSRLLLVLLHLERLLLPSTGSPSGRQSFCDQLVDLLSDTALQVHVLLVVDERTDALLADLRRRIPRFDEHRLRLHGDVNAADAAAPGSAPPATSDADFCNALDAIVVRVASLGATTGPAVDAVPAVPPAAGRQSAIERAGALLAAQRSAASVDPLPAVTPGPRVAVPAAPAAIASAAAAPAQAPAPAPAPGSSVLAGALSPSKPRAPAHAQAPAPALSTTASTPLRNAASGLHDAPAAISARQRRTRWAGSVVGGLALLGGLAWWLSPGRTSAPVTVGIPAGSERQAPIAPLPPAVVALPTPGTVSSSASPLPSPSLAAPAAPAPAPAPSLRTLVVADDAEAAPRLVAELAAALGGPEPAVVSPSWQVALASLADSPGLAVVRHDALQSAAAAAAPAPSGLQVLAPLYTEELVFVVRAGVPWKRLHEAGGARVNVGPPGSARALTAGTAWTALFGRPLAAARSDDGPPQQALQRVAAGGLDMVVLVGAQPFDALQALTPSQRSGLRVLALDRAHPSSTRLLRRFVPATLQAGAGGAGLPARPTAGVAMPTFLVAGAGADAGSLDAAAAALCAALPGLRRDGDARWSGVRLATQLPAGLPVAPAAAAFQRCDPLPAAKATEASAVTVPPPRAGSSAVARKTPSPPRAGSKGAATNQAKRPGSGAAAKPTQTTKAARVGKQADAGRRAGKAAPQVDRRSTGQRAPTVVPR